MQRGRMGARGDRIVGDQAWQRAGARLCEARPLLRAREHAVRVRLVPEPLLRILEQQDDLGTALAATDGAYARREREKDRRVLHTRACDDLLVNGARPGCVVEPQLVFIRRLRKLAARV